MTSRERVRAAVAVILAGCLFGTTGTAAHLAGAGAGADSVGLARLLVGGTVLFALAYAPSVRSLPASAASVRSVPADPSVRPSPSRRWAVLCGALAVLGYQPLFFLGVARNGVAVGTVVALGSAPVITGVIEAARRHGQGVRALPSRRWLWTTGLAVAGVALVSGLFEGGGRADLVGIAASVGAGACYSGYAVLAADLIAGGLGRSRTMGLLFGVAALLALPWWLTTDRAWLLTPPGAATVLWLGLFATAAAYLLLARGLGTLPTPTVATLTLAEPVTATLLGTLVLSERLRPAAAVGIAALGVALVALARQRPAPASTSDPSPAPAGC